MNRIIHRSLQIPVAGTPAEFRLTKLDAFSGASLLRLLLKHLPEDASAMSSGDLLTRIFVSLPDPDLRALMALCLAHAEMKLPAGYTRVYSDGFWSIPELEHDAAACLRLTLEAALFTLEGFFGESGSPSAAAPRDT